MAWNPTATTIEDWARLRLLINNTDVTYYRGVPFVLGEYSKNQPFGDATLTVRFPQISCFEVLPSWLVDHSDVELRGVRPDTTQFTLWEGLWVAEDSELAESDDGLSISCIGALYQVDFYRKAPELRRYGNGQNDIALLIAAEFDTTKRPALRTSPIVLPGYTGVTFAQKGAWETSLSGYVQQLLSIATVSGLPQPGEAVVGIEASPSGEGYWLVGSMGSVLAFGDARYSGSMVGTRLNKEMVAIARHPTDAYWLAAWDGGVFTFGYTAQFMGSLGASPPAQDVIAIAARPQGDGYWLVDTIGTVYPFGAAVDYGGSPALVGDDEIIAIETTSTGLGYWLASSDGGVFAYGDAPFHGSTAIGNIVDMAARPNDAGYWLLESDGTIYGFGTSPAYGPATPTGGATGIAAMPSGLGVFVTDAIGGVFAYGDADFHGSVPGGGGATSQWTIDKLPNRQPKLVVKNTWDVQWTLACGDQGVSHSLSRDTIMAPNVRYGEGVDPDGCIWRNTRYPNLNPDTAPVFGGTDLVLGLTDGDALLWSTRMKELGWQIAVAGSTFTREMANVARTFQRSRGLTETGTVNAQTWAASFDVGSNGGDLNGAYFAPLAFKTEVDPWLYNARGDVAIANPSFDRTLARIEAYDNYGAQVTKWEGQISAQAALDQQYPATYAGTITLKIDPQEGSRFEIEAGDNLLYRYFRGDDVQFHIAGVAVNWEDGSVTLEVDTQARDMVSLAALRQRVRDQTSPTNRPSNRRSQVVEDRKVVWDCESGAGVIPYQAVTPGLWQINRIPAGEFGQVELTEITCDYPSRMAIAVCSKEITPSMILTNIGAYPDDAGFWSHELAVAAWEEMGLIMGWGGEGQMGGFYPGKESDDDAQTGRFRDDASWTFESTQPPWLWVAMWIESGDGGVGLGTQYVQGRLYPGAMT